MHIHTPDFLAAFAAARLSVAFGLGLPLYEEHADAQRTCVPPGSRYRDPYPYL
jgi:hypothetical protein